MGRQKQGMSHCSEQQRQQCHQTCKIYLESVPVTGAVMRYDPGRDLRWLLLRPWVAIPRLIQVLWTLGGLILVLLL